MYTTSLKHEKKYEVLRVALRNFFHDHGQGNSLAGFSSVRALLFERKERDALLDDEEEGKEGPKQQMMETNKEKAEEALDYLLDVAIKRFGYAARVVFRAVFDFDETTQEFRDAFSISFQQLKDTVASLSANREIDFKLSNRIVAISPIYSTSNPFGRVDWKLSFNSDWVTGEIMKNLNSAENIEVRQIVV